MPINPKAMAIVAGLFVLVYAWRTWRSWWFRRRAARLPVIVPANLVAGSPRTWLVFDSSSLAEDLRRRHPRDRVLDLDAARYPHLAASVGVRPGSPAAVLADEQGRIRARAAR